MNVANKTFTYIKKNSTIYSRITKVKEKGLKD